MVAFIGHICYNLLILLRTAFFSSRQFAKSGGNAMEYVDITPAHRAQANAFIAAVEEEAAAQVRDR